MSESKLCGWIWYTNGEIDRDMSSAGMLYGVHYAQVEDILEDLYDNFYDYGSDHLNGEELAGNGCIDFELTDLSWDEGEMSSPEECQWDIAPHWEFDFNVTKHEKFPDDEEDKCLLPASSWGNDL